MESILAVLFFVALIASIVFFKKAKKQKKNNEDYSDNKKKAWICLAVTILSLIVFSFFSNPSESGNSSSVKKPEQKETTKEDKPNMESFKAKCDEMMKELNNDYYNSWISSGGYLVLEVSNNGVADETRSAIEGNKEARASWNILRDSVLSDYKKLVSAAKESGIDNPLISYNVVDETDTTKYLLTVQGGVVAYDAVEEAVAEAINSATTGEKNALKSAQSYLNYTAFSYDGLIRQLEFEGYTESEAIFAVNNCEADWMEQALKCAKSYLNYTAFSYDGLIRQLEFEGFTSEEATHGVDNCGADWYEQAAKCAKNYLDYSSFSKSSLINQLEFEGFTHDQAVYGAEQNGY